MKDTDKIKFGRGDSGIGKSYLPYCAGATGFFPFFTGLKRLLLLALFAVTVPGYGQSAEELLRYKDKYILILSSHSHEHEWENHLSQEIRRKLEKARPDFPTKVEYVGTNKRNSMIATRYAMQGVFLQNRIRPAVLVIIGDESWMTYRKMRLGGWSKVPVVLCVNEKIMEDYSVYFDSARVTDADLIPVSLSFPREMKVTGIAQKRDPAPTLRLIRRLFPEKDRIVFFSSKIYEDDYLLNELQKTIGSRFPEFRLEVYEHTFGNTDTLVSLIKSFSPASVILCNEWHAYQKFLQSVDSTFKSLWESPDFPPVFVLQDIHFKGHTIVGGCYPLRSTYSDRLTEDVLRMLEGLPAGSLPFVSLADSVACLNRAALMARGITRKIPGAVYFHTPPGFFKQNQRNILIALLLACITVSAFSIHIRNRKNRKELEAVYGCYKKLYAELRMIYNSMPLGLLLFDAEGKLLRESPEMKKFREKYPQLSGTGNLFTSVLCTAGIRQKVENGIPIDEIVSLETVEGEENVRSFFRVLVRYIGAELQNRPRILVILLDNTSIFQEKIQKDKIWDVFQFATDAVRLGVAEYNLLDGTGFATDAWYRNTGKKKNTPFSGIYRHFPAEERQKLTGFIARVREKEAVLFNEVLRIKLPGQPMHWLRYIVRVMEYAPENGRIILAELNLNMDKQKAVEHELQTALQKARESDALKSAFIANMGHEIRTPLNAITGFAELLIQSTEQEEKQQYVSLIEDNTAILLRLIGDIIDLSKIESGTLEFAFEETDLCSLLTGITAEARLKTGSGLVKVLTEVPVQSLPVYTDKIRLKQVINNFVSNALKFTVRGEIRIGCRTEERTVYIYVADTGCGIPKERQSHIFDRFMSWAGKASGFGLGLSISKSIVEHLGGDIGVESVEGKGSVFWCRLPLSSHFMPERK